MSTIKKIQRIVTIAIIGISLLLSTVQLGDKDAQDVNLQEDVDFLFYANNQNFDGRKLLTCESTDGSSNSTTGCTCGNATCGANTFCNSATNECLESVKASCTQTAGFVKNSVTCICGSEVSCANTSQCLIGGVNCTVNATSIADVTPTAANAAGVATSIPIPASGATKNQLTEAADLLLKIFSVENITSEVMAAATTKMSSMIMAMLTTTATTEEKAALVQKIVAAVEKAAMASISLVSSSEPAQAVSTATFAIATYYMTAGTSRRLAVTNQTAGTWNVILPDISAFNQKVLNLLGYKTFATPLSLYSTANPLVAISSNGLKLFLQNADSTQQSWTGDSTNYNKTVNLTQTYTNAVLSTNENLILLRGALLSDQARLANGLSPTYLMLIHTDNLLPGGYATTGVSIVSITGGPTTDITVKMTTTVVNKQFFIASNVPSTASASSSQAGTGSVSSGSEKLLAGLLIGATMIF